jgi:predicted dehydrogenase
MNRRNFLQTAALGASFASRSVAANDRIGVAIIGLGGQGRHLTGKFAAQPDVDIHYLCEVDESRYEAGAKLVSDQKGKRPPLISDLRKALADKAVDAVVVATPDHWHGPATILACDAGKDVYVEKPASHNLREGRLMVEAARRNKRIVQLGTQSRSRPSTQRAVELAHSGKIGKVVAVKAFDVQLRANIGHKENSQPPAGVDYETWLGVAPFVPFNENHFHYKWHWHWNFGTGDMGNDGVHQLDQARWALGGEMPAEVAGMGRKLFFDDDQRTPDTMNVSFSYPDKVLIWEMRIWNPYGMADQENGVEVYGSTGMIQIGRWKKQWGYKLYDDKGKLVEDNSKNETDADPAHVRNFLDCVKSRKAPNAEIAIGHTSSALCHLGNIVAKTGRSLKFDGKTESITGDAEANRLLSREYRKHWATPKKV